MYNYERHSHTHCWDQKQPPACNINLEAHTQCCLCDLKRETHTKNCCEKCRGQKSEARGVLNRCEYILCPCHFIKPLEEETCELCGGKDGEHEEVSRMESVYPGEPHMADVGSGPCPNYQPKEEDYDA